EREAINADNVAPTTSERSADMRREFATRDSAAAPEPQSKAIEQSGRTQLADLDTKAPASQKDEDANTRQAAPRPTAAPPTGATAPSTAATAAPSTEATAPPSTAAPSTEATAPPSTAATVARERRADLAGAVPPASSVPSPDVSARDSAAKP